LDEGSIPSGSTEAASPAQKARGFVRMHMGSRFIPPPGCGNPLRLHRDGKPCAESAGLCAQARGAVCFLRSCENAFGFGGGKKTPRRFYIKEVFSPSYRGNSNLTSNVSVFGIQRLWYTRQMVFAMSGMARSTALSKVSFKPSNIFLFAIEQVESISTQSVTVPSMPSSIAEEGY